MFIEPTRNPETSSGLPESGHPGRMFEPVGFFCPLAQVS